METGSSIHEEQSHFPRNSTVAKLAKLETLLVSRPSFRNPSMIKLDTQGSEISVLQGCPTLLRSVEAILLEVSLVPTNKGIPTFAEVISFMDSAQFQLFDFCSQLRRKDRVLWQTDLLFVRRGGSIQVPTVLSPSNWG